MKRYVIEMDISVPDDWADKDMLTRSNMALDMLLLEHGKGVRDPRVVVHETLLTHIAPPQPAPKPKKVRK